MREGSGGAQRAGSRALQEAPQGPGLEAPFDEIGDAGVAAGGGSSASGAADDDIPF
jgi:hypothetical protein